MSQRSSPTGLPDPYATPTASVDFQRRSLEPPKSSFDAVLTARGWQVFVFLLSAWLLPLGVFFAVVAEPMADHPSLFLLIMVLQEVSYFGWCVAVALAMNARVPLQKRLNQRLPLYCLAAVVASMLYLSTLVGVGAAWESYVGIQVLVSVFGNLYLLWFTGRSLVAAEEQQAQGGLRVLGTMAVLWISLSFPIAAWLVHERARRVAHIAPRTRRDPPATVA